MHAYVNLGGSNSDIDGSNDRDGGYGRGLQPPAANNPDNGEIDGQRNANSGGNDGAGPGLMDSNPGKADNQEAQSAENEEQEQRNNEYRVDAEREETHQNCAINVDDGQPQTKDAVNKDAHEGQMTELSIQESATGTYTGQSMSYAELANCKDIKRRI